MKKSSPDPAAAQRQPAVPAGSRAARLQPPATGAHIGSPAAPVMKQFAKTPAESSGR